MKKWRGAKTSRTKQALIANVKIMKTFPMLSLVLVRSTFSAYHNQIGMVLTGGRHWQAVMFGCKLSVFHPDEIILLPKSTAISRTDEHFLKICAWCPDRKIADEVILWKAGWTISHGICRTCELNWKKQMNQKYGKANICSRTS
jgi:hypothetical protein